MLKKLLLRSSNVSDKSSISYQCRKKRMQEFEAFYKREVRSDKPEASILDVGGTFNFWNTMEFCDLSVANIVLLNTGKTEIPASYSNITSVVGDARDMKAYGNKHFDLVFSNSVIEHVGGLEDQRRMAHEMLRVGKHCYLQTPNRYFFLEPHFLIPFFQFFPLKVKAFLIRHFQLGNMPKGNTEADALEIARSVRLMTKKELKLLFPEIEIRSEKFLFLTKSFYLYF